MPISVTVTQAQAAALYRGSRVLYTLRNNGTVERLAFVEQQIVCTVPQSEGMQAAQVLATYAQGQPVEVESLSA